ncbi:E3 ubiquitin-protein ligase TRIM39-like isoform X2 [Protopterus annectens]|uniref:E3 ubiquitin-protein ligase TRIM39-like isoform X2 n=1 Tax=Protopterus annectens TaxID=7888 RepID=UPI001CF99D71|nr:E3 ubiquitin-protein ligase TRIM39-like isoform X2 [Protopterus annectens]
MSLRSQLFRLKAEATCTICLEFYNDPVSIECGHSFCALCIKNFWDSGEENTAFCPMCRKTFPKKGFSPNRQLAGIVECLQQLIQTEMHERQRNCSCTTGNNSQEAQNCVKCRRKLSNITDVGGCVKMSVQLTKVQLEKSLTRIQQRMQKVMNLKKEKEINISNIKALSESLRKGIQGDFKQLKCFLDQEEEAMLLRLKAEEDRKVKKVEECIKSIQHEIECLQVIERDIQKVQTLDGPALHTNSDDVLSRANIQFEDLDTDIIHMNTGAFNCPIQYLLWKKMAKVVNPAPESLILDSDTANPRLWLSADLTQVECSDKEHQFLNNSTRFDTFPCVLTSEGFTSGKHYWEIEVPQNPEWIIGLARASSSRKGKLMIQPDNGFWTIGFLSQNNYKALTCPEMRLTPITPMHRVGIYLDYEGKELSFYNASSMSYLCTFSDTWEEKVYPFIYINSSKPLKIIHFML